MFANGASALADSMHFWNFVTDYGDSAVTLPLALVTLAILFASGASRLLRAWLIAVGVCGVSVALLKIGLGCGADGPLGRPFSPSGHTAMSTLVYGGLTLIGVQGFARPWRIAAVAAVLAGVVVIGISRLLLHDHTVAEVAIGFLIGGASLGLLAWLSRGVEVRIDWHRLLAGALLVMVVMHGTRWPIEEALHRVTAMIRIEIPSCK